jgi:hypothetical protein
MDPKTKKFGAIALVAGAAAVGFLVISRTPPAGTSLTSPPTAATKALPSEVPVAQLPALPAPAASPASSAQTSAVAASGAMPASAPTTGQLPDKEVAALRARLAQVETELHDLTEGLRLGGYLSAGADGHGWNVKAYPVAARKPENTPRKPQARVAKLQSPTASPVTAASPAPEVVQPGNQLLAIDLWDDRPSVVVGTGIAGDKRVRVLQSGDSQNGVTVRAVNLGSGRVQFDVNGRDITLSVPPAQ